MLCVGTDTLRPSSESQFTLILSFLAPVGSEKSLSGLRLLSPIFIMVATLDS